MSQIVFQHYARPGTRPQLYAGLLISAVALLFLLQQSYNWLQAHPTAALGLQASLLAGMATGLGALPVLALRRIPGHWMQPLLGLAGGMMLAASLFSLLWPAAQAVTESSNTSLLGLLTVSACALGALFMKKLDARTEHAHLDATPPPTGSNLHLVIMAIALHNLPEGLAVGIGVSAGNNTAIGWGIALQNIPEGWIIASALLSLGTSPLKAAAWALASGLVEPIGGIFGVLAGSQANWSLAPSLAAAAGAMLWVVWHEMLPAARNQGRGRGGQSGLLAGFLLMWVLAAPSF